MVGGEIPEADITGGDVRFFDYGTGYAPGHRGPSFGCTVPSSPTRHHSPQPPSSRERRPGAVRTHRLVFHQALVLQATRQEAACQMKTIAAPLALIATCVLADLAAAQSLEYIPPPTDQPAYAQVLAATERQRRCRIEIEPRRVLLKNAESVF